MPTPLETAYTGDGDPAVWLDTINQDERPHFYPIWPDDYPEHLAVCLTPEGGMAVATSWKSMMEGRGIMNLWFCRVPKDKFVASTTADPAWFKGDSDGDSESQPD